MQITRDTVVSVHYRLQRDNPEGELIEETFNGNPLTFLFGVGQMIPDFEQNLEGKMVGDKHAFGITSENAYGPVNQDAIVDLPIETFIIDGKLAEDLLVVGKTIPMSDNHGSQLMGTVKEVKKESVKIDFNHPMAGQDLFFTIEVLQVRPATQSELEHGHVHGPGGEHH
ncbi:MAG: peptidylprolyl isomerase [Saprospiraceae bacterium]|jgi:FKBP-type peptidyl-prolyl cis-trans isomerase SlyD